MSGEKGPLRDWEKLYWGVFVSAIAFLLWSKLLRGTPIETEDDTQVKRLPWSARVVFRLWTSFLMTLGT